MKNVGCSRVYAKGRETIIATIKQSVVPKIHSVRWSIHTRNNFESFHLLVHKLNISHCFMNIDITLLYIFSTSSASDVCMQLIMYATTNTDKHADDYAS